MHAHVAAAPTGLSRRPVSRGVLKRALQLLVSAIVLALAMFVPAGRIDWWQAWAFLGIYVGAIVFNALVVVRHHPDLVAERAETAPNAASWDAILKGVLTVFTLLTLAVAGLDVRWGGSRVPFAAAVTSLVVVVVGNAAVSWAMAVNRFYARVVRIQHDRGQQVCSSGPYRFVRHPGYVGSIVYSVALPFALGSLWAVIPALLVVGGFVVRTALEDRLLQAELEGYREYAARVRFRLWPGLW